MNSFEDVKADLHGKLLPEATRNMQRAGLFIVQEMRKAIKLKTKVSSGAQGSMGSLQSNAKIEANLVRLQIGLGPNGDYLKYRLWGVAPAAGAFWAPHSKMPPVHKLVKWAKQSGITVPAWAVAQAKANAKRAESTHKHPKFDAKKDAPWNSTDAHVVWAFRIAQNIKKYGTKVLQHPNGGRLFEQILALNAEKITQLVAGGTAA